MVKGDKDVLSAVRNLKQQTIRNQNLALDEAADVVMATLDRITPVDTARLLGNVAKSKPRSKKGIRQIDVGYAGKSGSGAAGWRAHFVDTGTIKQHPQNIRIRTEAASIDEVERVMVEHMKVK